MPLGFRKIGHLPDEAERVGEVPELECSLKPLSFVLMTLMSPDLFRR